MLERDRLGWENVNRKVIVVNDFGWKFEGVYWMMNII